MRQRLLTLCMVVGCAALIATSVIITFSQDKTAPVIKIENKEKEITYNDGDDYEELLADVTAKDNRDGDVTSKIFVDSITPVSDESKVIVRYAVIDKSNNVGVKTRIVNYGGSSKSKEKTEEPKTDQTKEETQKTETTTAKEENKKEETADAENKTEDQMTEEKEEKGELTPNGVKPAIRLTESSKTIKAGERFDVLSVIDQLADDKDDPSTLSRRIHADGEYDTSTPGTYTIRYYVMDTNNNTSNIEEFTLKVQ